MRDSRTIFRRTLLVAVVMAIAVSVLALLNYARYPGSDYTAHSDSLEGQLYYEPVNSTGKIVLMLNSYEPTFTSSWAEINGVAQTLNESGVACDVEFMQTHIDTTEAEKKAFLTKIRRRLRDRRYDGLVASDDAALQFIMDHRRDLFADLPVVFLGVNDVDRAQKACAMKNITGILEYADQAGTIAVARRVLPKATKVVGIVDSTDSGVGDQKAFIQAMMQFPDLQGSMLNSSTMTREEFGKKLGTYGEDTIILYTSCFDDLDGNIYTIPESASFIAAHAKIPVFRCNAGGIGNGIIGGRIMNFRHSGQLAAETLLQALAHNQDLSDIPLNQEKDGMYLFDAKVMKHYGIATAVLPVGTQLINYNPTYWERNASVLIPLGVILLSLVLLLLFYLRSYRSSHRYADSLEESQTELSRTNRELRSSQGNLRRANENLRYLSLHDTLTGLRNRQCLEQKKEEFLNQPLLILFTDVDRFKYFNDLYGHHVGDGVLTLFARCLADTFGKEHCYRYGGDEFLMVFVNTGIDEVRPKIEQIQLQLAQARVDELELNILTSWGYVTGVAQTKQDFTDMVRVADLHIYEARDRESGKLVGGPFDRSLISTESIEHRLSARSTDRRIDQLTGLYTMTFFLSRSPEILANRSQKKAPVSILYFNLVNFRIYNESYGFEEGDKLLQSVAHTIQEVFPRGLAARFAEDHFVVLAAVAENQADIRKVQKRVSRAGHGARISLKCGVCPYQPDIPVSALCDRAKAACEQITTNPEDIRIYSEDLDEQLRDRQYVLTHLDEALEKGYIRPYYQPIVRTTTVRVCGEEALARWTDPELGVLSPARFIDVLEQEQQIWRIDLQIIRAVLEDFRAREQWGISLHPISVNLSRVDFEWMDMVKEVTSLVDFYGVDHSLICIEITESAFMEQTAKLRSIIDGFHQNGFRVWMDDFGSGYSSLNLLQEFDFDLIKLDMRFMKNFARGTRNEQIVGSLIRLARELGIQVLCEGVETREQFELLRELGCERLQGFYFCPPHPLDFVLDHLQAQAGMPSEWPQEMDYYDQIDSVNLYDPLSNYLTEEGGEALIQGEVPSGIIEVRGDGYFLLNANEAYLQLCERIGLAGERVPMWDVVPQGDREVDPDSAFVTDFHEFEPLRLTQQPEEAFRDAVQRALESGRWEVIHEGHEEELTLQSRVHRIADNALTGARAVLVVVQNYH